MEKVVAIILINNENKLLFHLRDNKPSISYPGYWSLLGGHLEEGETMEQAIKREIKEEIDYNLRAPIFLGSFNDYSIGKLVYVYKSKVNKKLDELKLTEGQKISYFDFGEAIKLKLPEPLSDFLIKNKDKIFD